MSTKVTLTERRQLSKKASARRQIIRELNGNKETERLKIADRKANKRAKKAHKTATKPMV